MWIDALAKEMYNVGVAFEVLDEREQTPNGWKKVTGYLVCDVKMDFTRKALMGTRCLIQWDHFSPRWCPGRAYGLLSPMLHSMDWISSQQTLGMPTYRLHHLRRITLFVVLSLGLKM